MPSFQYSLRAFLTFVFFAALVVGLVVVLTRVEQSIYTLGGIAGRGFAVMLVVAVIGLPLHSLLKALVSAIIGVVFADIVWVAFLLSIGSTARAENVVYNPLLLITLVTCPVACVESRARAFTIAIILSIVLPVIAAAWNIANLATRPPVSGSGLAAVMTIIVASSAMATGAIGMALARCAVEFIDVAVKTQKR